MQQERVKRPYRKLHAKESVEIALLDKQGKSLREIAQSTGRGFSTVASVLRQLSEGRVPGASDWTLDRFNAELEKRSRRQVYQWQSIAEDSSYIISHGLKGIADKLDTEGLDASELDKISKIAMQAVTILDKLEKYTDSEQREEKKSYEGMSGSELLDKLSKIQRQLRRTTVEGEVVENTEQSVQVEDKPASTEEGGFTIAPPAGSHRTLAIHNIVTTSDIAPIDHLVQPDRSPLEPLDPPMPLRSAAATLAPIHSIVPVHTESVVEDVPVHTEGSLESPEIGLEAGTQKAQEPENNDPPINSEKGGTAELFPTSSVNLDATEEKEDSKEKERGD